MFRFFPGGPAHRALQSCPTPEFDDATGEPHERSEWEAQELINRAKQSGAWEEASSELNIPDDRIYQVGKPKKGRYDTKSGKVLDHNAVEEVWVEIYSTDGGGGPRHVADYLEKKTIIDRYSLINKRSESLKKFSEDPRITTEYGKQGGWYYMQKIPQIKKVAEAAAGAAAARAAAARAAARAAAAATAAVAENVADILGAGAIGEELPKIEFFG